VLIGHIANFVLGLERMYLREELVKWPPKQLQELHSFELHLWMRHDAASIKSPPQNQDWEGTEDRKERAVG